MNDPQEVFRTVVLEIITQVSYWSLCVIQTVTALGSENQADKKAKMRQIGGQGSSPGLRQSWSGTGKITARGSSNLV